MVCRGCGIRSRRTAGYEHTAEDTDAWTTDCYLVRFGLYELDPVTQERTPRRSAELYGALVRGNAITGSLRASGHARASNDLPLGSGLAHITHRIPYFLVNAVRDRLVMANQKFGP